MPYVSGKIIAGQKTGIDSNAVQLHATQQCREVLIQNDPGNAGNLLVGDVNGQYVVLTPGQSVTIPIISLQRVYVKMSTGSGSANWLARD